MKDKLPTSIKDVTETWKKQAKPKEGIILVSDYTMAKSGNRYDSLNGLLEKPRLEDIVVGTWFMNTVWGDVKLQRAIDYPQNEPSADLLVLNNCHLINEQTIEIKTISNTSRIDGIRSAIKSAKNQSNNVLLDMSKSSFSKEIVIKESLGSLYRYSWLKTVIIKNKKSLIKVYMKK